MQINKSKLLANQQFYSSLHKKEIIFWHHTAGTSASGAIDWWNQTPEHVGTAFVIDRDGTIYQCFDPKAWGYHLGVKRDDDFIEKNSIGIELVAAGNLTKVGNKFMFYPLFPNTLHGKEIPKEEVWDMGEKGWRGNRYYHAYSDKQIKSLIDLTNQLIVDFDIKVPANWKDIDFTKFNEDIYKKHLAGIWSHSSVRNDKNDIVPNPEFLKKIYEGINTPNKSTSQPITQQPQQPQKVQEIKPQKPDKRKRK